MSRLFWVAVGVSGTLYAQRKGREMAQRYSPPAVAARTAHSVQTQAEDLLARLAAGLRGFGDDLQAGSQARAEELRRDSTRPATDDVSVPSDLRSPHRGASAPGTQVPLDEF